MARTLSQFITEQDAPISANVPEDSLERTYVETMLAVNTANYYLEAVNLVGFADECNINTSIVQEAGDTPEAGKKNIFQKAGNAVKGAWKWFIEMLKSLWSKIAGIFKKNKVVSTADQFTSIFDQFKEKYPEVKESMTYGDYFAFLQKNFPKAVIDMKAEDVLALTKYGALHDAVEATNAVMDEIIKQGKDSKAMPQIDVSWMQMKINPIKQNWSGASKFFTFEKDANGKVTDVKEIKSGDQSMSTILAEISKVKAFKVSLDELCVDGKAKLTTVTEILNRYDEAERKLAEGKAAENEKKGLMDDISTAVVNSGNVTTNKASLNYLKKWVDTLTKMEADVTTGYTKVSAMVEKIAGKALDEAMEKSDKGYKLESVAYLV